MNPDQARNFVLPDLGPNCLQRLLAGKEIIIIRMLTLCTLVNPKWVLWQTVKTQIKCRIKDGISPGSTQFAIMTKSIFREIIQRYIGNYYLLPLQYTMDQTRFLHIKQPLGVIFCAIYFNNLAK